MLTNGHATIFVSNGFPNGHSGWEVWSDAVDAVGIGDNAPCALYDFWRIVYGDIRNYHNDGIQDICYREGLYRAYYGPAIIQVISPNTTYGDLIHLNLVLRLIGHMLKTELTEHIYDLETRVFWCLFNRRAERYGYEIAIGNKPEWRITK